MLHLLDFPDRVFMSDSIDRQNLKQKHDDYRPPCIYVTPSGFECLLYRDNTASFCNLLSEGEHLRTEAYLTVEIVIHDDNVISTRQAPRCFVSKTT